MEGNGIYWDWDLLGLEFHQQQFPFRGIGFVKLGWCYHFIRVFH